MNSLEAQVKIALRNLPEAAVCLAAFSGGADSTAMLAAMSVLRNEMGFSLNALHVEHGMRPAKESRGDARAAIKFCQDLDVPLKVISIPQGRIARAGVEWGIGPEAAARFFRHRALQREAVRIGAHKILTAHTRDDLLENILIRILRGSGPAGLAILPAESGRILRPLLNLTRTDVLAYLNELGISYRTDSTNNETRYLRNRIRLKLIPCLDGFFPSWKKALFNLAETQSLTAEFIKDEAAGRLPWNDDNEGSGNPAKNDPVKNVPIKNVPVKNVLWVNKEKFFNEPEILREEAVFLAADKTVSQGFYGKSVSVLRRLSLRNCLADMDGTKSAAADLGKIRLELKKNRLYVTRASPRCFETDFAFLIDAPGSYKFGKYALTAAVNPEKNAVGDVFFASFPLVLRKPRSGDIIYKAGHNCRFSDIFKKKAQNGPAFRNILAAEDKDGTAAFFGTNGQTVFLFCRDDNPRPGAFGFHLKTAGGIDVR